MKNDQNRNTGSSLRRVIKVLPFLFFLFFILSPDLLGQQIVIEANRQPLNEVLIDLLKEHDLQVSFDDRLLSQYPVTINQTFETIDEAIASLLEPLPLDFEKSEGVYIIFKKEAAPEKVEYRISGRIIDRLSGESLPYSNLLINKVGVTTDFSGHFSYSSSSASSFRVSVSHLGYFYLDTLLTAGQDHC